MARNGAWVGSIKRASLGLDIGQMARSKILIFGLEVAHMLVNNMVVQVVAKYSGKIEKSDRQHGHPLDHRGPGSIKRSSLGLDIGQLARSKIPIFGPEVSHRLVNNMVVQWVAKYSGKVDKSEGQHGHPLSHRGPGRGLLVQGRLARVGRLAAPNFFFFFKLPK